MEPPQGRAEGEENLPDLLPTLLLMHPRIPLAFLAPRARWGEATEVFLPFPGKRPARGAVRRSGALTSFGPQGVLGSSAGFAASSRSSRRGRPGAELVVRGGTHENLGKNLTFWFFFFPLSFGRSAPVVSTVGFCPMFIPFVW